MGVPLGVLHDHAKLVTYHYLVHAQIGDSLHLHRRKRLGPSQDLILKYHDHRPKMTVSSGALIPVTWL